MANRHDPDQNVSETYVLFELREQLWQKHMRNSDGNVKRRKLEKVSLDDFHLSKEIFQEYSSMFSIELKAYTKIMKYSQTKVQSI